MSPSGVSVGGGGVDLAPGGGITPSGGDISSDLGATLSSAFDSAFSDTPADTPAEVVPDTPAESAPDTTVEASPEVSVDTPAPDATPAPTTAPAPGEVPYQLTPDGKAYQIPKAEFATIQQAQKYHSTVSQLFPTPQHAQTSYEQAADLRGMLNDYLTGQGVDAVLNYWAGGDHASNPQTQQRFQQAFTQMAQKAPDMLAKINPQAYQQHVDSTVKKAIEMAYDKAVQTGSEDDLKRAQELDWGVTGQYKTELPKVDPQLKAQQEFEARQQQFNQHLQSRLDGDLRSFNTSQLEGAKFNQVNGLIDHTLDKIKDRFSDIAYNDLRTGISTELKNAMAGLATPSYPQGIPGQREWFAEHKQAWDQIVNDYKYAWNRDPAQAAQTLQGQANAYRQAYINRANQYLPAIAAPRVTAVTRTPGTARTAPAGKAPVKAATQPAATPAPDPKKRLSSEEWQNELNATLTIA